MSQKRLLAWLLPVFATLFVAGSALSADLATLVTNLVAGGYSERDAAIGALAASGEARAAPILQALSAGDLYVRNADKVVVIGKGSGKQVALIDALTGKPAGTADEDDLEKVKVNNRLRGTIDAAMGSLTLMSPDPRVRRQASESLFTRRDASALAALDPAIAAEKDPAIKRSMTEARAAIVLTTPDTTPAQKLEAIALVRDRGDRDAMAVLQIAAAATEGEVKAAALAGAETVRNTLAAWSMAQNVWYGISLGSVLLLAAIGLAITFGTMGVINMAHGEMVMLGAYTTFVVQQVLRQRRAAAQRVLGHHRAAARLPGLGRHGRGDRALHHPLPLWPLARHPARDLGPVAGPAAGCPLDLRPDQPRGRARRPGCRARSRSVSSM